MFKKILIVIALIVIVVVIVVALQPADFRITRTASIAAPPAAVFAEVNNLHRWEAWLPWAKLDPDMKQTYEGPDAGVGASNSWAGNSKVGEGRMTIIESQPNERIALRLEFLKPFQATSTTEFTFKPEGDHTIVTWDMTGKNNFMAKGASLVMNMDKMVGGDFEKGLEQLNAAVGKP